MAFKCQEDSFLKEYSSKVIKCTETSESLVDYGKVLPFNGYEVTLENTILFPAGGGQPHDLGWLNNVEVLQVLRKGDEAVHFTKEALEVGTTVHQRVNWQRRFDHMQQHSGQHLLSAILEKEHGLSTTSWWLGADECYVELDSTKVSDEVISTVEARCNELIRAAIPVNVKLYKANDPALNEAHTRGLPKDCTDTIRVICIGDVDENMCCGTHVSNLRYVKFTNPHWPSASVNYGPLPSSPDFEEETRAQQWDIKGQLQIIKLLGAVPGKKNKTNLRFLVGDRVTKTFQCMLNREKALTALLKNEPSKHEELVTKIQKNIKTANKNLLNVLSELAQYEIEKVKKSEPKAKYLVLFKPEATPEFCKIICKGLENEGMFLLLVSQEPGKNEGQIIIQGPEEACNDLGQPIIQAFMAKGAFKNGKFQGKATDLNGIKQCSMLIEDYFKSK